MATPAVKLGLREDGRLLVLGLSGEDAARIVGDVPAGASVRDEGEEAADVVLLFAVDVGAVHADVVGAAGLVDGGGRLWVAYRKGARALNRDTLQHALGEHGLVGVALVAL